jgi:hypothetical protein
MVIIAVLEGKRPKRPMQDDLSDDMWTLIGQCWAQNPAERHNIVDINKKLHKIVTLSRPNPSPPRLTQMDIMDTSCEPRSTRMSAPLLAQSRPPTPPPKEGMLGYRHVPPTLPAPVKRSHSGLDTRRDSSGLSGLFAADTIRPRHAGNALDPNVRTSKSKFRSALHRMRKIFKF